MLLGPGFAPGMIFITAGTSSAILAHPVERGLLGPSPNPRGQPCNRAKVDDRSGSWAYGRSPFLRAPASPQTAPRLQYLGSRPEAGTGPPAVAHSTGLGRWIVQAGRALTDVGSQPGWPPPRRRRQADLLPGRPQPTTSLQSRRPRRHPSSGNQVAQDEPAGPSAGATLARRLACS
jgi:hypothetical protein